MEDQGIYETDGSEQNSSQRRKNSNLSVFLPIALAVVLAAGYFLGTMQKSPAVEDFNGNEDELVKLNRVLNEIQVKYVDTIEEEQLVEASIEGILKNLDPHSSYIPAKDLDNMDEPLRGGFGGIGIRFMILRDTLVVTNVIDRGPSQQVGMRAGDRIISINDMMVAGVGLTNTDVFDQLKGDLGSRVRVGIYRKSDQEELIFDITRGMVPIKSIESQQMVTNDIGYIKLARFAETTPAEFIHAAKRLKNNGMKKLILDLRDNGGGYLQPAVALSDHFLGNGKMIVYTEGRYNGRINYRATSTGLLEKVDVAILINANTASASEIVSGAVQDNDRGIVLGRRSYGKGLVQEPIQLPDGSAIRLTVARYYTPSGRCIQKPYGNGVDYHSDFNDRYENGEFYELDSSRLVELEKFETAGGRTVYGGGGIFPDIFIPLDTVGSSHYLTALAYTPAFSEFAFEYVDQNRRSLGAFRNAKEYDASFQVTDQMFENFVAFAGENHDVAADPYGIRASKERIKTRLKAQIAQNVWDENGWFTVFIKKDKEVIRAIEEIGKR